MRFDQNVAENRILMRRLGPISTFRLPQKEGYPPTQKLSRTKQRIGFALENLKNGQESD